MDGGTIDVVYSDKDQARRVIRLGQVAFKEYHDPKCIPGRLYLDGNLVPIGSTQEEELKSTLMAFSQLRTVDPIDRKIMLQAFEFIGSQEYLELPSVVVHVPIDGRHPG